MVIERGHSPVVRIAWLHLQLRPVDRPAIQPRRCARLEPAVAQADLAHLLAQRDRSSFASATTVLDFLTQENACIQERAGSNNQRPAPDRPRTGSQSDD